MVSCWIWKKKNVGVDNRDMHGFGFVRLNVCQFHINKSRRKRMFCMSTSPISCSDLLRVRVCYVYLEIYIPISTVHFIRSEFRISDYWIPWQNLFNFVCSKFAFPPLFNGSFCHWQHVELHGLHSITEIPCTTIENKTNIWYDLHVTRSRLYFFPVRCS